MLARRLQHHRERSHHDTYLVFDLFTLYFTRQCMNDRLFKLNMAGFMHITKQTTADREHHNAGNQNSV